MILPIITLHDKNPILTTKAALVTKCADSAIQKLIDDMTETMYEKDGVGLAATQVGQPLRISVVVPFPEHFEECRKNKSGALVLINPFIVKHSLFKKSKEEACLSVPGVFGIVKRWEQVTISYSDRLGAQQRMSARGLLAHVFQHEIDHLDGILFINRAKKLYRVPSL